MLQADNISVHYGDERVLDCFSCHIERGTFTCVSGVSGCGKTSLLKAFMGLAPLTEGAIRVGEHILNEQTCNAIRRQVTYLPQDLALPYDTVAEAVAHVLKIGGLRYDHAARQLLCVNLGKLGLEEDLLDRRMVEISGGQRQRLVLAVLALLDREVWLLDEPTAALDRASRDYVIEFLVEQQQRGKTIVAVSHDVWFAAQCSVTIQLG
jgi:putative ABC transport system ATP-binding protein